MKRFTVLWHGGHGRLAYVSLLRGHQLRRPNWIERRLVAIWNPIVCAVIGHDRVLESIPDTWDAAGRFACTACCRRLTPVRRCGKTETE